MEKSLYFISRKLLFEHMIKDHGFNIGNPDNISEYISFNFCAFHLSLCISNICINLVYLLLWPIHLRI